MKPWYFLLFLIAFASCSQVPSDEEIRRELPGDWDEPWWPFDFESRQAGKDYWSFGLQTDHFTFYTDGTVEPKNGFVKRIIVSEGNSRYNAHYKFLGLRSRWKIKNSILSIFNPIDSSWKEANIIHFEKDTLKLLFENKFTQTFYRNHYLSDTSFKFDKIVLSTTGCLGTCPSADIMITADRKFYYNGGLYSGLKGLHMGNLPYGAFEAIADNFRKTRLDYLKDYYDIEHTDDRYIITTFINKDTIVKSIMDYGAAAPREFVWGYLPMEMSHHLFPSKKYNAPLLEYLHYADIYQVESPNKFHLFNSFLLWQFLENGQIVQKNFVPHYYIRVTHENLLPVINFESILTDGRHFEIREKGKTKKTIDIGFNFFDKNPGLLKNKSYMP